MKTKDTTASSDTTLVIRRTYNAPRERVFAAWTDPERLRAFFVPEGCSIHSLSIDPRPDGKYAIAIHSPKGLVTVHGEYLEVVKPQRLVFTMLWDEDEDLTHVTLEFFARGNATELVLTHERLDRPELREGLRDGWTSVFENLGKLFA